MYKTRIAKIAASFPEGCLIDNPSDLLYLTGLLLSLGRLWISKNGVFLFVDGRYFASAKKEAPCTVVSMEDFSIPSEAKTVAFDSAFLSYAEGTKLQTRFPAVQWNPVPNLLKHHRVVKEPNEIAALERAAKLTWDGYNHILRQLKEGVTEREMAWEFEKFCREHGASGLSFDSIIAFGENSAYPHYRAGQARLQKDQIVLIDVGAVVDQYHGDMTRVFFFGQPHPELLRLDRIVKKAQKKAVSLVRPGIKLGELDQAVREEFQKEKVEQLYTHSLGHGIGLETHEYPRLKINGEDKDILVRPGMVFTIEPGLYQPGLGGIRHEDMILATETGGKNFFY